MIPSQAPDPIQMYFILSAIPNGVCRGDAVVLGLSSVPMRGR